MFYDNYVIACNRKQLKPTVVAVALGFNKSVVSYWKRSGKSPTDANLAKIAEYLDTSVEFLLNGENSSDDTDEITFDDFTYAMYDHAKDLTEDEKKMLLEMAEFMKKKRGL